MGDELRDAGMSQRWFALAGLMVLGSVVLMVVGPQGGPATMAGLGIHAAGWLLGGVVAGSRLRSRMQSEPWTPGLQGEADDRPGAFSRALAASSPTGLALMLVGAWLAPAAILGMFGLPILLAGAVACFLASMATRRPGGVRPTIGAFLLGLGWFAAAVAAVGVASLVGGGRRHRARDVLPSLSIWVAAPILVGLGLHLRSGLGRRDRLARASVVVGLLLAVAVLAALTRGLLPRSL